MKKSKAALCARLFFSHAKQPTKHTTQTFRTFPNHDFHSTCLLLLLYKDNPDCDQPQAAQPFDNKTRQQSADEHANAKGNGEKSHPSSRTIHTASRSYCQYSLLPKIGDKKIRTAVFRMSGFAFIVRQCCRVRHGRCCRVPPPHQTRWTVDAP